MWASFTEGEAGLVLGVFIIYWELDWKKRL